MIFLRNTVLVIILILTPFAMLWMIIHKKSFDKVTEWCIYGTTYEKSDLHKLIEELKNEREKRSR